VLCLQPVHPLLVEAGIQDVQPKDDRGHDLLELTRLSRRLPLALVVPHSLPSKHRLITARPYERYRRLYIHCSILTLIGVFLYIVILLHLDSKVPRVLPGSEESLVGYPRLDGFAEPLTCITSLPFRHPSPLAAPANGPPVAFAKVFLYTVKSAAYVSATVSPTP